MKYLKKIKVSNKDKDAKIKDKEYYMVEVEAGYYVPRDCTYPTTAEGVHELDADLKAIDVKDKIKLKSTVANKIKDKKNKIKDKKDKEAKL